MTFLIFKFVYFLTDKLNFFGKTSYKLYIRIRVFFRKSALIFLGMVENEF